ncbi:cell division protein ZapD [Candidatus Steffania adelgidicola]|uniref:cell division protein ZapD n=1 Tax=Candidatus Steffania adelgidicola TaxID=1076626 RepID=UPI001D02AE92|nr:cell division protein ZapD [Candidatus Steffania adelgidicola]UDG80144.1 Cell division protein ZapD [Candidatus Steffania adelgidicola]
MSDVYATTVLFEYPLNEKIRIWLRLEFLLQQLYRHQILSKITNALMFFRTLSDLRDILERGDIRSEMLKELDRQQQKLLLWEGVPGVDGERISTLCCEFKRCATTLMAAPRLGQVLREDRLIGAVRQRLSIPGSGCSFDLPALHSWLHLPSQQRDAQVETWLQTLDPLNSALNRILDIMRHSEPFRNKMSLNGFYQDNAEDGDLLRLRIPVEPQLYPQVSGHKTRYAIRFLSLDSENGVVPNRLAFELACC